MFSAVSVFFIIILINSSFDVQLLTVFLSSCSHSPKKEVFPLYLCWCGQLRIQGRCKRFFGNNFSNSASFPRASVQDSFSISWVLEHSTKTFWASHRRLDPHWGSHGFFFISRLKHTKFTIVSVFTYTFSLRGIAWSCLKHCFKELRIPWE